jgi:hypothetical protein
VDDERASGKAAYVVGDAALVDEPPASEVGRWAAAADAEAKGAAESPYAPATDARSEAAARTKDMATVAAVGTRVGPSPLKPASIAPHKFDVSRSK